MQQQGDLHSVLGSPGEKRRKEKETLRHLNERLETVLGNIRKDNIIKSRQIKDLEGEARTATDVSALIRDDQRNTDKAVKEVIIDKSRQLAKVAKNSSIRKENDDDLTNIGSFESWPGGDDVTQDLASKFIELCTAIAGKKLMVMRATEEKIYGDYLVSTIESALQTIDHNINQQDVKVNGLKAEEAILREQVSDLKKKNEEATRKVALYENPELEDAMQERIWLALDRKEKLLQAALKDKIDAKAQELADASASGNPSAFITPRKMDLYGEAARLENENTQLEEQRVALDVQLKRATAEKEKRAEKLKVLRLRADTMQKSITASEERSVALTEDITALKSDGSADKKIQDINKQISDQDANDAVRLVKYNKAKQILLSGLDDTETKFKNVVNLDAVLKEYENIITDYEVQYTGKRQGHIFAPMPHPPVSQTTPPGVQSARPSPSKKPRTPKVQTKPRTRSATKASQGFPSTAGKETSARSQRPVPETVKFAIPEELENQDKSEEEASGSASSSSEDDHAFFTPSASVPTPAESGKKKRKEPPADTEENISMEIQIPATPPSVTGSQLEITSFSAVAQRVVIKNISDESVNLTGYKIRNCDYNVSQLFPNVTLPSGSSFTINPMPKNVPAKLPKFTMFWHDGYFGTFEQKDSKGVRILNTRNEIVCVKK